MDAEDLGRKTAADPSGILWEPWKADCEYCDGISQNTNPASLVHHNAATHNAAMHNASFSQRYQYPFFYSVIAVMPFPVFQHRP